MNTKTANPLRIYQLFFLALGIFCIGAITINLIVRRAPVHDATIEADFTSIAGAIDSYVAAQSMMPPKLPASLSDLSELPSATQKRLGDYDYNPISTSRYQLCATFLTASEGRNAGKPYYGTENDYVDPSRHSKGRECFTYTVTSISRPQPLGR